MNLFSRPEGLLGLTAGFLLWSSAFLMLYGGHALGCAYGWDNRTLGPFSMLTVTLAGILLVHLAGFFILLALVNGLDRLSRTGGPGFIRHLSLALSIAALIATAWLGLPILAYPACS
jgi:hypothetical protein